MTTPTSAPLPPDLEPDEKWKETLKVNIEDGLRSMYEEAMQHLNDELAKAPVSPEARERINEDHLAALRTIRNLAEEQFRIALERERQERRWASGEQLDRAWSESMMMEQQAILDRIEKERKNKSQTDTRPPPPPPPQFRPDPPPETSLRRKPSRTPTQIIDAFDRDEPEAIPAFPRTRTARAGSITSRADERSILGKPLHDEPEPTRRESIRRKPSIARTMVQEFWKPSITPEEDAHMSRTFTLARRSSNASASSYKAPSVLHATLSDPLDVASERAEEWSPPYRPPPSASRPIAPKRSFTIDDFPQSSPTARWPRYGFESRSPQTPEDRWQQPLRPRFSSQDMRHHYFQDHRVREDFEELDDAFDWRPRDSLERRMQELDEALRKREEEATRREDELAKKAEELRREENVRRREQQRELEEEARDEQRKADELRRKEEEADRKEKEAAMKEEEARKREEEARKKEEETKKKEEEVKRKEKETRRKEEEIKRKEEEAKSRETEARRREEEARRKEDEVRVLEDEARRKEHEAREKQEEAERKQEEARRKTEEISMKAEETRKKEEELRKREEEVRRREEELNRREAEMRRREEDRTQEEFRKREEEIRRQRAEEKKKQEVWETWPQETFRPTPSPQTPNSSGPWPIPTRNERSGSTTTSPSISTSASGRNVSGWSSARPGSAQPSSTPKPTAPATPTPKPPTTPVTEAEFHRRQAEQAQQREEQFRREQARIAMLEHERQAKAGKTMSKEEVSKLFGTHREQWEKLNTVGTLGELIWEDFPWPMFKRPKGPDELTSPAVTAYMLSSVHTAERAPKDRIKESIRRWHSDRFTNQFLSKVKVSEWERVSEGAGTVTRILNELLRTM